MAHSFNTNLKTVASLYIKLLNVKVTKATIQSAVECSPFYPSLLSLSDTFGKFNIKNTAYGILRDDVLSLEPPYLAYLKLPGFGNDFVLVTKVSASEVIFYADKKPNRMAPQIFVSNYRGVVLIAQPDENSGDQLFERKRKRELNDLKKKSFLIFNAVACLIGLFLFNYKMAFFWSYLTICLLKLTGVYVVIALMLYEKGGEKTLVSKLCTTGTKINCKAVLNSKMSTVMGFTWSEVGLYYFISSFALLIVPSIFLKDKLFYISILSGLAAPYILFSLFYQWKIIRQWCSFCLVIQGVLLTELTWSVLTVWTRLPQNSIDSSILYIATFVFSASLLICYAIKSYINATLEMGQLNTSYKRLRSNPDVFYSQLQHQKFAAPGWEKLGLLIGRSDAPNTIIKVCHPFCGPCSLVHPKLEKIIKRNPNFKLIIIFKVTDSVHDKGHIVASHLLEISQKATQDVMNDSLDFWYNAKNKDYHVFQEKYPVNSSLALQNEKISAMQRWCEDADIVFTPTIFINGYQIPDNFDIQDIEDVFL